MIADRMLWPVLQRHVWDPVSPTWFHARVRQRFIVREVWVNKLFALAIGYACNVAILMPFVKVFFVHVLLQEPDSLHLILGTLLASIPAACVLTLFGLEVLEAMALVRSGRRDYARFADEVRCDLTAHQRVDYEAATRAAR